MTTNAVLFLTNTYPDSPASTRGKFIEKMATLLQKEGFPIFVVTPKVFRGTAYAEEQNGLRIYRFPFLARGKLLIEYEKIPYLRMILYFLSGFLVTVFVLFKRHCPLIHVHWAIPTGVIAVVTRALFRKPFVVTIHGSDFRMAMEGPSFLRKIFLVVCRKASHIHCVSEAMRKEIEKMGIEPRKLSVSSMGVDNAFLEIGKQRVRKRADPSFTILSDRKLHPLYNVSLLIRAIPLVLQKEARARFLIAGDGPERESLEVQSRRLKVDPSVQFLGQVPPDQMPDLLGKSDIYVSTSLNDGASVSLLEAMASGAFPIVTAIPANLEWVADGKNGFLVPLGREDILATRILDAIGNEGFVEQCRSQNLEVIQQRGLWPVTVEKTKRLYDELLGREKETDQAMSATPEPLSDHTEPTYSGR